jgi:long-chain-acyl-CoA dehydrogenase
VSRCAWFLPQLPQERLLIASMGVAAAEACFEMTRDYVKERKAFGTTLFKGMQTIRHELAEIKTEVAVSLALPLLLLHSQGCAPSGSTSSVDACLAE